MSDDAINVRADDTQPTKRPTVLRFLYTQNPFYLISVAFILNGTGYWFRQGGGVHNPWPLMALICGYIAMMAVTVFVIVRVGKVWEDARSIFLILPVLFVELSLTFDDVLISNHTTGTALQVLGLLMSILTTEGLLLGLRIRMPALFRVPMHAMYALLFLYPLLVVSGDYPSDHIAVAWKVFAFSPIAAIVLMTLIPAIRRGRSYVKDSGTPWMWPCFPWGLFAILGIALAVRTYALSLSFDPLSLDPMELRGIYGAYFLVPILMALAVLFLETSIVEKLSAARWIGMSIPLGCIVLAASHGDGVASTQFYDLFTNRFGSPVYASLLAACGFFAYATARRIPHAAKFLVASAALMTVVGPQTDSMATLVEPQTNPIWLLAAMLTAHGIARHNSQYTLIGLVCAFAASKLQFCDFWTLREQFSVASYMLTGLALVVSILFRDEFAKMLGHVGIRLLFLLCVVETVMPRAFPDEVLMSSAFISQATIVVISLICAYGLGSMSYFVSGLASGSVLLAHVSWQFALHLRRIPQGEALTWMLLGIVWFVVAAMISAYKARILHKIVPWLPLPHPRRLSITKRGG